MLIALVAGAIAAIATAIVAARAAAAESKRIATRAVAEARDAAAAAIAAAEVEASAHRRALETAARAEALDQIAATDEQLARAEAELQRREDRVQAALVKLAAAADQLEQREAQVDVAQREVDSRRDRSAGIEREIDNRRREGRTQLEARAGVIAAELAKRMRDGWLDDARAKAAASVRVLEQATSDPAYDREAKRVMEIAAARCSMHFLTERNASNLRVGADMVALLLDNDSAIHGALQKVAGVQLLVNDDKDAIRLDGLDGVGKEVVRRSLAKFGKKPESVADARAHPDEWAVKQREIINQEIRGLGKKAFQSLGIQKAHPEIVELVGALNFRTSYTQNQWLHAVEASFLAGMMAAELGLDEKLARRATLMHDIGKALTHKIEGSHAVIGAEIARRLGEPEVIANAIGAHHADEPCNSVYAYLVAASDAMSGARPGARREQTEGFSTKIEDLERIGFERRGVSHAHAVQGGRELRVYVREREVDDLAVVEMSTEIAAQVSDELTFPGQIKVTVIRSFEATATAN